MMSSVSIEYAKALYETISSKKRHEITLLFDASLSMLNEGLNKILNNPRVKKDDKKEIINELFDSSIYRDFLMVLIDNDRINLLEEIKDDYLSILNNDDKIVDVKVYSSELLSESYLDSLKEKLEKRIESKVRLINLIDDEIIGGIRITYDSKEIDLTVNKRFDDLILQLKE